MAKHKMMVKFFCGAILLSFGLTFSAPPAYAGDLPGDANRDGVVDGADFDIWEMNKFTSGGWESGDFNTDGLIDVSDFNIWNTNRAAPVRSPLAVPEPGGLILAGLAIVGLALRRRR